MGKHLHSRAIHPRIPVIVILVLTIAYAVAFVRAQQPPPPPRDAVAQAQQPASTPATRPEQVKSDHDRSNVFEPPQAQPASPVFDKQPKQGS